MVTRRATSFMKHCAKETDPNPGQLLRSTLFNVVVTSYILVFK